MKYKRNENNVAVAFDKGEEIVSTLNKLLEIEKDIKFAEVFAIGAINHLKVGTFNPNVKEYKITTLDGNFEICSLLGTIVLSDGKKMSHLHIVVADEEGKTYGGHLFEATVSLTCEMSLNDVNSFEINKVNNNELGIKTWSFE